MDERESAWKVYKRTIKWNATLVKEGPDKLQPSSSYNRETVKDE